MTKHLTQSKKERNGFQTVGSVSVWGEKEIIVEYFAD
jgi:hypothetical protein